MPLMWLLLSAAPGAEVLDRVLAVVAGDLILMSDVRVARDFGFITVGGADPDGQALARLIDRALILAEVERFAPPEPEAAAVDKGLALVRERFPSEAAFAAALAQAGIEERHLREYVRQDQRMTAYLDQRFTSVPPPEEEIGRYYREHSELFTRNGVLLPFETRAARGRPVADDTEPRRAGAGLARRSSPPRGRQWAIGNTKVRNLEFGIWNAFQNSRFQFQFQLIPNFAVRTTCPPTETVRAAGD